MKKLTLALLLFLPLFGLSKDNTDSTAFGTVSQIDLSMTECDFDKNAEAVVIFDIEETKFIEYSNTVNTEITRHIRIKILKDKGLEEGSIKLRYYNSHGLETISDIVAQTYNLDKSGSIVVTKLDKKNIFDKPYNKDYSEKVFALPDVRKGSVIEYSYKKSSTLGGGLNSYLFQHAIPVKMSRYTVTCPADIEISTQAVCTLPYAKESKIVHNANVYQFQMKNIPALRDEPYISCDDDYLQKVDTRIVAYNTGTRRVSFRESWYTVINKLLNDDDFGGQLDKNISPTDTLDQFISKTTDPYKKMSSIFAYVRDRMEWNKVRSIWSIDGVKKAWKDKKGYNSDINFILINLLRKAGLDANPILVSSHSNGIVNINIEDYDQFDDIMAYVVINKKHYVLDASDKFASPSMTPWRVMYTQGLLVKKPGNFESEFRSLWDEKQEFNNTVVINADISSDGTMTGESNVSSSGYSRTERISLLIPDKSKYVEKFIKSEKSDIKIDSFSFENLNNDTLALVQNIKFHQSLNVSGDYKYFKTNMFSGFEKNPFIADFRFSDIFFGAFQNYTLIGYYNLPEGYVLEDVPKNVKMIMPDTSLIFSRQFMLHNDRLMMRTTIEFKKPFYKVNDYDYFREFYKKMFDLLDEQIVLTKKP